jgi:predicted metal-dependent hydrolase
MSGGLSKPFLSGPVRLASQRQGEQGSGGGMAEVTVLSGDPQIRVRLVQAARARRVGLRVSRLDGQVTLSVPPGCPRKVALDFLHAREGWLRRALAGLAPLRVVAPGVLLPVEGQALRITHAAVRHVRPEGAALLVPERKPAGPWVAAWLRRLATLRLHAASTRHGGTLGRDFGRITLRDTRSRWGSCTARGDLMYSWRLVLAPPEVLDYVAAHEVAHLARMDHSPAFWRVVAGLCPDYARHRDWLRRNGNDLHGWSFAAPANGAIDAEPEA